MKMDLVDAFNTTFRTPKGNFYYTVTPFRLKNTGSTYQHAMTYIFDNLLHHLVECYVDDMVAKPKDRKNHQDDLRVVFERLHRHRLKMNPLKCAFAVRSGVFLGFVVWHRDQAKEDQSDHEDAAASRAEETEVTTREAGVHPTLDLQPLRTHPAFLQDHEERRVVRVGRGVSKWV